GHLVPELGQPGGVAARSAGGVQGAPDGQRVEQRPDRGLLHADQRVPGAVVRRRPTGVTRAGVQLRGVAPPPLRPLLAPCPPVASSPLSTIRRPSSRRAAAVASSPSSR